MELSRVARAASALALVAAVGATLSACSHLTAPSGASVRPFGEVTVNGQAMKAGQSVRVRTDDLVNVRSGSAQVALPGGARLEMRTGSVVRFSGAPMLIGGDLLAQSGSLPLKVETSLAEVTVQGVARLRRDQAITVGSYTGHVLVGAGRTVMLPALTEDTIPSVSVVPNPVPLRLDGTDSWDQRLLGAAIEITDELDSQSRYMNANVPAAQASSVAFYSSGLSALSGATAVLHDTNAPVGDGLTAAAIALAGPGDFTARWREVFALRAAGAQWGIVVLQEAANAGRVLQLVEAAVTNASIVVPTTEAPGAPIVAIGPAQVPAVTHPATAASSLPPAVPKAKTKSSTPAAVHPPAAPTTTRPPLTQLLNPIVDPLHNLLAGLLGANKR